MPDMITLKIGNKTYDIRDSRIGDLADLDTTAKNSLVSAINEVFAGSAPTDQQVQEAVDAWLEAHPEATTTVEDGSITKAKLVAALSSEITQNTEDVADLKSAVDFDNHTFSTQEQPAYVNSLVKTASVGSNRYFTYYQFIQGLKYHVKITINAIPAKGSSTWFQINTATVIGGTVVDNISPQINSISVGDVFEYTFVPSSNAMAYYIFVSAAESNTVNIDVEITPPEIIGTPVEGNYQRIAFAEKVSPMETAETEARWFPMKMKSGKTYYFRILLNLVDVKDSINDGTIAALAADTLTSSNTTSVHDVFFRTAYRATGSSANSTLSGTKNWYYFSYTAQHDSEYLYCLLQFCGQGSWCAVECMESSKSGDLYSVTALGNRSVTGEKPYLFKRVCKFPGTFAQSVTEMDGYIYIAYDGGVYKYLNGINVSTKTSSALEHAINISAMSNGHLLLSSITDYNAENEVRHIYEYDFDSNSVVNDYIPTVSGLVLCFSEVLSDGVLLLGYKLKTSTNPQTISWYKYNTSDGALTLISTTEIDRLYVQGGCLIGNTLYISMNNATLDENCNAAVASINLKSGEIKSIITLDNFGETEGFCVAKDRLSSDVIAYVLENGIAWLWQIKM